jgi:hypothetical protein
MLAPLYPRGLAAGRRRRPHPVLFSPRGFAGLGVVQVLDPSITSTIAGTIQQVEGYYPGSLAYQNNNPGNLIYVGQAGATAGAGGFAKFATYADGLAALNNQIQLYAARGMTIDQMMNVYAPSTDGNNPTSYAAQIAAALGVSPSTSLLDLSGISTGPAELPALPDLASWLPDFSGMDPATLGILAAGLVAGVIVLNVSRN